MQSRNAIAISTVLLATLSIMGVATAVLAHKGASGVVMQRMNAMKSMADGMKALSLMVTGKAPYDAAETKKIAATIKGHAAGMAKLFPKGSIDGPSEALPKIWTDWDAFVGQATSLEKLAVDLDAAADKGKVASLAMFAKIGKVCSGCHQDFRQKKKKE